MLRNPSKLVCPRQNKKLLPLLGVRVGQIALGILVLRWKNLFRRISGISSNIYRTITWRPRCICLALGLMALPSDLEMHYFVQI
jgi:hypothetical protein